MTDSPVLGWILTLGTIAVLLYAAAIAIELLTKGARRLQHAAVYLATMFFEWRSRRRQRRRGR